MADEQKAAFLRDAVGFDRETGEQPSNDALTTKYGIPPHTVRQILNREGVVKVRGVGRIRTYTATD